jgi:hypothetical protein
LFIPIPPKIQNIIQYYFLVSPKLVSGISIEKTALLFKGEYIFKLAVVSLNETVELFEIMNS